MNIKCTQNIFKSANGTSEITYYILQPEGVELRGIVQLSHGMCEYFTRYTQFAKYLCGLGFIVCGNDHLGHGSTAAKSTDLGFFAARDGWRYLVDDMETLTGIMRERFPDYPYFVLGHSMGSLITRLYAARSGEALAGCILIGTAGPTPLAKTAARVANSISRSRGITYRSGFLSKLAFQNFNRKIKPRRTTFDWLTRDDEIVALYLSDEKCNFLFTSAGYRDLFTLLLQANAPRCFKNTPRTLPMLLLSGDMDPVGAYGDGVRQVANLYRGAGVKNLDVIFYKGSRHEILNELNSREVFGDISRWLEARLAKPEAKETEEPKHATDDDGNHLEPEL